MINFKTTREEFDLIVKIAQRFEKEFGILSPDDYRSMLMDLNACHCNGCPLDLQAMLTMPQLDFAHDVGGIRRHMDRTTGQLKDCFVPRAARREGSAA